MAGAGYNSDEEVYAAARAADGGEQYDSDDNPVGPGVVDRKKIEPLPPLDHGAIEYDDFAKDFYEEAPAIAAMTPAEVRSGFFVDPTLGSMQPSHTVACSPSTQPASSLQGTCVAMSQMQACLLHAGHAQCCGSPWEYSQAGVRGTRPAEAGAPSVLGHASHAAPIKTYQVPGAGLQPAPEPSACCVGR